MRLEQRDGGADLGRCPDSNWHAHELTVGGVIDDLAAVRPPPQWVAPFFEICHFPPPGVGKLSMVTLSGGPVSPAMYAIDLPSGETRPCDRFRDTRQLAHHVGGRLPPLVRILRERTPDDVIERGRRRGLMR